MGKRGASKKKGCDAHHYQTHAKKPERRKEVRQVLSSAHFNSPTLAVSEALESGRKRKRGFFNGRREEKLNFMLGVLSRAER